MGATVATQTGGTYGVEHTLTISSMSNKAVCLPISSGSTGGDLDPPPSEVAFELQEDLSAACITPAVLSEIRTRP